MQTVRLALPPFPDWWTEAATTAADFAAQWRAAGADYNSLRPVRLSHESAWVDRIPDLLAATNVLFATIEIADENDRINLNHIHHTANVFQ